MRSFDELRADIAALFDRMKALAAAAPGSALTTAGAPSSDIGMGCG
jgi:hypothetical protein